MTKCVAWCSLICLFAVVVVCSLKQPELLSEKNSFMKDFVGKDFLALLWVILTITIGSASQLHLSFNQLEEHYHRIGGLQKARDGVKQAVYILIGLFLLSIVLVIVKPLIASKPWIQSLLNGTAIWIIYFYVLVLIDLTQTVFAIPPRSD